MISQDVWDNPIRHLIYFFYILAKSFLFRLRFFGKPIHIHPTTRLGPGSVIRIFPSGEDYSIKIGAHCWIEENVRIMTYGGNIEIGNHSSVNDFTVIRGGGGIKIGSNVRIGPHCVLSGISHRFDRTDIPICEQGPVRKPILIEDDVWIGANTTVIDGVTIATGVVIGAGSVVTRKIPPYTIVGGNPARVIRHRKRATETSIGV